MSGWPLGFRVEGLSNQLSSKAPIADAWRPKFMSRKQTSTQPGGRLARVELPSSRLSHARVDDDVARLGADGLQGHALRLDPEHEDDDALHKEPGRDQAQDSRDSTLHVQKGDQEWDADVGEAPGCAAQTHAPQADLRRKELGHVGGDAERAERASKSRL